MTKIINQLRVVYTPALNILYAGIVGQGAFKITSHKQKFPIRASIDIGKEITVACSHSHPNTIEIKKFLSSFKETTSIISMGSSLKFCKIAEGSAHLYPRFGRTMEWDTAAGAVLMAAGGSVQTVSGERLDYGKENFENPNFIACSPLFVKKSRRCRA